MAQPASVGTKAGLQGTEAANMATHAPTRGAGTKSARDFSFLVTEDHQEPGPNLTMLDHDSDSDSYSSRRPEDLPAGDDDGDDGFEAGSAIDQLLWRQKAVSGMETRRPGESVHQFFQRRMAGMRMLKAEAGSSEAKNLETEARARFVPSQKTLFVRADPSLHDASDCHHPSPDLSLSFTVRL